MSFGLTVTKRLVFTLDSPCCQQGNYPIVKLPWTECSYGGIPGPKGQRYLHGGDRQVTNSGEKRAHTVIGRRQRQVSFNWYFNGDFDRRLLDSEQTEAASQSVGEISMMFASYRRTMHTKCQVSQQRKVSKGEVLLAGCDVTNVKAPQ